MGCAITSVVFIIIVWRTEERDILRAFLYNDGFLLWLGIKSDRYIRQEIIQKSISRSTVELGYRRAREMGSVKGSKALGLPGSGSYLYPILLRFGICRAE